MTMHEVKMAVLHYPAEIFDNEDDWDELASKVFDAFDGFVEFHSSGTTVFIDAMVEAPTVIDAFREALVRVRGLGLGVARLTPGDLVTLSEAAIRMGVSKQNLNNFRNRDDSFPSPIDQLGSSAAFRWESIAMWMLKKGKGDEQDVRRAKAIAKTNAALTLFAHTPKAERYISD